MGCVGRGCHSYRAWIGGAKLKMGMGVKIYWAKSFKGGAEKWRK